MRTLNRILLATDFSESAKNAAQVAAGIAASRQVELHIPTVHVAYAAQSPFAHDPYRTFYEAEKRRLENYSSPFILHAGFEGSETGLLYILPSQLRQTSDPL